MRIKLTIAVLGVLGAGAMAQDSTPRRPNTPEERQAMRERMARNDKAPKVGQLAPPIKLNSLDGEKSFDLAANIDKRPVILFFGSYT